MTDAKNYMPAAFSLLSEYFYCDPLDRVLNMPELAGVSRMIAKARSENASYEDLVEFGASELGNPVMARHMANRLAPEETA